MNSSGPGQPHRRKSSRTNSTSSSVVTIKKAASISSRSGSRTPRSATRPRSPDELGPQLAALLESSFDPIARGKRSSSWSRPGSPAGIKEGVGNLNRWSQSTASSASGQESGLARKRKNSISKRMSIGPLPMLGSETFERSQNNQAPDIRSASRRSPGEKLSRRDPPVQPTLDANLRLLQMGDLHALSSASNPLETPSTASATPLTAELLTPSTAPTDYFGEQWSSRQYATSNSPRSTPRPTRITESPRAQRNFQKSPQVLIDLATKPMPALPSESSSLETETKLRTWGAGHARGQGQNGTGSGDTDAGSSMSSAASERDPPQQRRSPAQKTMLSHALSRANSAVLLDNAQDFRGAIEAYADACRLLHQVMLRSSGDEDRNKLQAIRTTYTNRIAELVELEQTFARSRNRPAHDDYSSDHDYFQSNGVDYEDDPDFTGMVDQQQQSLMPADHPQRRQSLLPFGTDKMIENIQSAFHQPSIISSYYPSQSEVKTSFLTVQDSMRSEYMPPPLSPRRPLSPFSESQAKTGQSSGPAHVASQLVHHNRDPSQESTSWLNTVDESGASSPSSSLQSPTSFIQYGASNMEDSADQTELDFDLALDAAVNAAYDEPHGVYDEQNGSTDDDIMFMARRNIALAKEMVREVERETARSEDHRLAIAASSPETVRQQPPEENEDADYLDEEAEEEERLLEEMTRGFIMDDFEFNIQSKSALPRKSDSSSNFSGRTYGSSTGSTTITTGTSLSTLTESIPPAAKQAVPPPHPPPAGALPILPTPSLSPSQTPSVSQTPSNSRPLSFDKPPPGPGVRDRRLSGQNARQLKIETNPRRLSGASATKSQLPPIHAPSVQVPSPKPESERGDAALREKQDPPTSDIIAPGPPPQTTLTPLHTSDSLQTQSPATPASALGKGQTSEDGVSAIPPSPARFHNKPMPPPPATIRKNFSSSSLRMRNLSVTTAEMSDASPITPGSASFPLTKESSREAPPQVPALPTPTTGNFGLHGYGDGSLYLFDDPIYIPQTPGTPGSAKPNAPVPLEACPESFLLRPFWLMRCLYQTVAHPRGGYLTTKLFVPRDIWRVKNIKLKAVDDKISQCDLLTAALLKLAKVDTLDADAVLEEMQSFESVMEQVRSALQKKLGNEVGVSGSAGLFKGSPATEEPQTDPLAPKSSNVPGKSYLAGWRKLRSKGSGASTGSSSTPASSKDATKDSVTMATLPMTPQPSSRIAKRNAQQMQGTGPNASYMGALARLFDAVQVLDQIARQVEDPGLKCSSKTHVGLEFCTRNAAEFFGFYICRFALSDIGLMLDKFVKRGSEWVLV